MSKLARRGLLGVLALAVFSTHSAKTPPLRTGLMALYGADAVTIDRSMRDFKLPAEFEWKGRPNSASQTATLFGDPSKPGLYVQILKRGAGAVKFGLPSLVRGVRGSA